LVAKTFEQVEEKEEDALPVGPFVRRRQNFLFGGGYKIRGELAKTNSVSV
jgi:hypothetical protein